MSPSDRLQNATSVAGEPVIIMQPFWLFTWALAMSLTWLLPNHYPPWSSFHMDAWAAVFLAVAAVAVIYRSTGGFKPVSMACVALAMSLVVAMQYFTGLIYFAGTAWISLAYLLGFGFAILTGQMWESTTPGQVGDALLLAIGTAAIISVGLQLYGWLELEGLGIWSMNLVNGRPYANVGQPNQLATLLLWGLIAQAWAFRRRYVGIATFVSSAAFLIFGIALTGSRTAWIAMALLLAISWVWRKSLWISKRGPWLVFFFGLYFVFCCWAIGWVNDILELSALAPFELGRMTTGVRTEIWTSLTNAALSKPFFGFGWNQVASAQLSQAETSPVLNLVFGHSHNLILDFALWAGIPFALSVTLYFSYWLFTRLRADCSAEKILLLTMVVITANHAMLELPLHHAYFLLPLGLVVGAIDIKPVSSESLRVKFFSGGRILAVVWWMVVVFLLLVVIKDYQKIERSYEQLRFRQANPLIHPPAETPQVLLLTQWKDFFWLTNFEPTFAVKDAEIKRMIELTNIFPSAGFAQKTATALVERGRPDEAQLLLMRACRVNSVSQCDELRNAWANQARQNKRITFRSWP